MSGFVKNGMDKGSPMESDDRIEKIVDIYITAEAVRNMKHGNNSKDIDTQISETQTAQHTGSNYVKSRSSCAALVSLVLLCFLLMTAVIVLSVFIYTKTTNYTEERSQLLFNITILTENKDKLLTRNTNLTDEISQLLTRNTNLTDKISQLLTNITNLIEVKGNLTNERAQLKVKNQNLLKKIHILDGWTYNQSSYYYMSNISMNWDASRSECKTRGADLIIINNSEEQDFVNRMSDHTAVWIGINDILSEDTWRWVDGSTLNKNLSFWAKNEPNGKTTENCAVSADRVSQWPFLSGWLDISCAWNFYWICEMNILQLLQNLSDN